MTGFMVPGVRIAVVTGGHSLQDFDVSLADLDVILRELEEERAPA